MVIWRIQGDEIGPNSAGAAHFATREEAEAAIREYKAWCKERDKTVYVDGPKRVVIRDRVDLCRELDAVMGYGST